MPNTLQTLFDGIGGLLKSLTLKEVVSAFWAPLSIFVGAWAAFSFNNRRASRERIDKEVTEGNLALSVLAQFCNQQAQYTKHYIEPLGGKPDAWFRIMPGPPIDNGVSIELNKNNLGFLLQSSPAVWQQVILEEQRFYQVRGAIEERNSLLAKAWAKLEEAGTKHGDAIALSEVERIIGPVLFQQLKQLGGALIDNVTQNAASSMEANSALRKELVRSYPKRSFVNFSLPPPLPPPAVTPAPASAPRVALTLRRHRQPTGKYIPHEKDD